MDRYYMAQQDGFLHIIPTDEEIAKYGKQESTDTGGFDVKSVQDKAKKALKENPGNISMASRKFLEGLKGL